MSPSGKCHPSAGTGVFSECLTAIFGLIPQYQLQRYKDIVQKEGGKIGFSGRKLDMVLKGVTVLRKYRLLNFPHVWRKMYETKIC